MSRSGDPFGWWSRARYQIRRGWSAVLACGLIVAVMIALHVRDIAFLKAEGKPTKATIVSLSWRPLTRTGNTGWMSVVAQSEAGLTGSTSVPHDRLWGCRVGDPISAEQVGGRLRLNPWPCRRREPS